MEKKEIKFKDFVTGKNNFAKLSVKYNDISLELG